jgi:DNA-binding PadR family transcriptional regulator
VALADGPKHGYAVMSEVEELSEGRVRMGPGTLYGAVKKLLAEGLIEESDVRPDPELDDERRRYYRLTGTGRAVTAAEIDRLESLVRHGRRRLPRLGSL